MYVFIYRPIADTYILPHVIKKSLEKPSKNDVFLWGRDTELEHIRKMMEKPANNVM